MQEKLGMRLVACGNVQGRGSGGAGGELVQCDAKPYGD